MLFNNIKEWQKLLISFKFKRQAIWNIIKTLIIEYYENLNLKDLTLKKKLSSFRWINWIKLLLLYSNKLINIKLKIGIVNFKIKFLKKGKLLWINNRVI